jgi:hypothetical protein
MQKVPTAKQQSTIKDIIAWVDENSNDNTAAKKVEDFINKYIMHLNTNSLPSMIKQVLNISGMTNETNDKKNDLTKMVNNLMKK